MKKWIAKQQAKASLMKVFRNGEIGVNYSYSSNNGFVYPKILSIRFNYSEKSLSYFFSLPTGMDPKVIKKKEYCFRQVFGERIELKGDAKKFTLTVFTAHIPKIIPYNAKRFKEQAKKMKLPIVCGVDMNGQDVVYDMVENPHLLISGETGSGKSTQLRSILSSMIEYKSPDRLKMFLCDLKRSEFPIFRGVEHVEGVFVKPADMLPMLNYLREETIKRGDLLDAHAVAHIDDLPNPPHYILLCIDEFALLKKEKKIWDLVEEISSIGRALGIYLILSVLRPDRNTLDGVLKNNLTVRMGFMCADLINSRIIGTPGSEKLKHNGRFLMKSKGQDLKEIQAPYLDIDKAKELIKNHKSPITKDPNKEPSKRSDDPEIIDAIFEVLD